MFLNLVLGIVDRLRAPITAFGIDFDRFRELLRVKLLLEFRTSVLGQGGMGDVAFVLTLVGFWLMGILTGVAALVLGPSVWMGATTGLLMGMLFLLLIVHYGNILVDTTDIEQVAPHPVADRTLFASRLAHMMVYVGALAVVFMSGNLMLAVFRGPALAVLALGPLCAFLAVVLTVGVVAGAFAFLLRVLGPARFQRATLWMQVVVMAAMMGGGQLVRFFSRDAGPVLDENLHWLKWVFPPLHFVGLYDFVLGERTVENGAALGLALGLPLVAVIGTLKLASRFFVAGLDGSIHLGGTPRGGWRPTLFARLGVPLCRSHAQRAGFGLALALSRRDPFYLRAALPSLIAFPVMAIGMGLNLPDPPGLAPALALLVVGLPTVLQSALFCTDGEASWLLEASPVGERDAVLQGAVKGLIVGTIAPALLGAGLFLVLLRGSGEILPVILALELVAIAMLVSLLRWHHGMPFSRSPKQQAVDWSNMGHIFMLLLAGLFVAGVHVALAWNPWVLWISVVLSPVPMYALFRRVDRIRLHAGRRR